MNIFEWLQKMNEERKLREIDRNSVLNGTAQWDVIPASMYYTHTEEEIRQIKAKAIERVKKVVDELCD
ncbi:MAG: hypothetical protein IJZ85_03535 [Lachnospiraceae bacterium]|nr:hypothetical protein [Lachnospiraceae bacterium]